MWEFLSRLLGLGSAAVPDAPRTPLTRAFHDLNTKLMHRGAVTLPESEALMLTLRGFTVRDGSAVLNLYYFAKVIKEVSETHGQALVDYAYHDATFPAAVRALLPSHDQASDHENGYLKTLLDKLDTICGSWSLPRTTRALHILLSNLTNSCRIYASHPLTIKEEQRFFNAIVEFINSASMRALIAELQCPKTGLVGMGLHAMDLIHRGLNCFHPLGAENVLMLKNVFRDFIMDKLELEFNKPGPSIIKDYAEVIKNIIYPEGGYLPAAARARRQANMPDVKTFLLERAGFGAIPLGAMRFANAMKDHMLPYMPALVNAFYSEVPHEDRMAFLPPKEEMLKVINDVQVDLNKQCGEGFIGAVAYCDTAFAFLLAQMQGVPTTPSDSHHTGRR